VINKFVGEIAVQDNVPNSAVTLPSNSPSDGTDESAWNKARRDMIAKHIATNRTDERELQQNRLVISFLHAECPLFTLFLQ
jgi:hypothetical protein